MCERKYFAKVSVTIDLCQEKLLVKTRPYASVTYLLSHEMISIILLILLTTYYFKTYGVSNLVCFNLVKERAERK